QMEPQGEVRHWQQPDLARCKPRLSGRGFGPMRIAAGVIGDARERAVLAALDMTAESCSAADLDRGHDAPLTEAQMSLVGSAPSSAVAAEDVRDFKSWMGHCRRINPALSS